VANRPLRILQVSAGDLLGGAEKVAWDLFHGYAARGCDSWLVCGQKQTQEPNVFLLRGERRPGKWVQFWRGLERSLLAWDHRVAGGVRGAWRLSRLAVALAEPGKWFDRYRGRQDFRFPETWRLLALPPQLPDLVHGHTLHGRYFDLRVLPWLSQQVPVVLTLHDAWLLSGLCWHSFDCERWKTGCGQCPHLTLYPAVYAGVRRDATAFNWKRKQKIYHRSRLYVATPSRWLMHKVEQSILAPAVIEARVIPNGVDLSLYQPAPDKAAVRAALGIEPGTKVLLFAANGVRTNQNKDYPTLRQAVAQVAEQRGGSPCLFIALGEDAPPERVGTAEVRFVPFQKDPRVVAQYYQAADLYLHAAHADTFPNTVLEALACGTPVVATAVGGIPEQVSGLAVPGGPLPALNEYRAEEATGILVPPRDPQGMASSCTYLLHDAGLHQCLSANAARHARQKFDLQRQVDQYLEWYEHVLQTHADPKHGRRTGTDLLPRER
jgi:glycosyltransferase involved in cell wall biosynthesis